jgi:hypothetical protein
MALTGLERAGIVVGITSGVAGLLISLVGFVSSQSAQHRADEREQSSQALQIITAVVPGDPGHVAVQNYSDLPVAWLTVTTAAGRQELGTLPPCFEFDITKQMLARNHNSDPEQHEVIGVEFLDAQGREWHRESNDGPNAGLLPDDDVTGILARGLSHKAKHRLQKYSRIASCG